MEFWVVQESSNTDKPRPQLGGVAGVNFYIKSITEYTVKTHLLQCSYFVQQEQNNICSHQTRSVRLEYTENAFADRHCLLRSPRSPVGLGGAFLQMKGKAKWKDTKREGRKGEKHPPPK